MSDRVKKHRALKKYMNNRPQLPNTPSLLLSMSGIVNNHDTNNHDDDNNLNSETIGDNFMKRETNYSAFYADYEFDDENSSKSDCVDNNNQFRHPTESVVIACNKTDADNGDSNNESIAEES
ncbi:hypothetical protein PV327_011023, partial [Microctonus hyperodae]